MTTEVAPYARRDEHPAGSDAGDQSVYQPLLLDPDQSSFIRLYGAYLDAILVDGRWSVVRAQGADGSFHYYDNWNVYRPDGGGTYRTGG